ncbi:MAG TPA: dihydroorotate dehydrogenase-like protein [Candidatus Limnocylindrales bacterium]|nr:dihydroorotate dehydrogenase-like protein [Candidatus Limnocylindrales bacterium]
MIDISTQYLGLKLRSPIVASASPLCESIANLRRMEDVGIGAAVLPSLFEEQLDIESETVDSSLSLGEESFAESLNYLPDLRTYNLGPEGYLDLIRRAKQALSIPVIASLNGVSLSGWLRYAALMQQAGADAIELNLYGIAADPDVPGSLVEQEYCEIVSEVKSSVSIPVAVKLSPFFTSIPYAARRMDEAGADALVLFNRFYQPEFDLEALDVVPRLTLSDSHELLMRLHWIAILYGRVRANLAVTGGVHTAEDVLKSMMAGASVAMMTSALLEQGIGHVTTVLDQLVRWMEDHEYESIRQMQGSMSRRSAPHPNAFERVNYMRVLSSYALREPR